MPTANPSDPTANGTGRNSPEFRCGKRAPIRAGSSRARCSVGAGTTGTTRAIASATRPDALRTLASVRGLGFGAAVDPSVLASKPRYREVLAAEFNMVTPENHMKWTLIHPEHDRYDFTAADQIVAFAEANGMRIRGHNLLWHTQNLKWLEGGSFSRDELLLVLHEHIKTVAGRYKGRIAQWDVVNEAVDADGTLRKTLWLDGIGPDYLDFAFRYAREADPDAKLYYNDYGGEGKGVKSDAIFKLVSDMKARGVPIHGVGLQMHDILRISPAAADIAANMSRIAGLGLDVAVTEMDVALKLPADSAQLDEQATTYRDTLATCVAAPNCHTLCSGVSPIATVGARVSAGLRRRAALRHRLQTQTRVHGVQGRAAIALTASTRVLLQS